MRLPHACLVLALVSACTSDSGHPFAELRPTVQARWSVPADRALPDGWARLGSDFQVRLTRASLTLHPIELVAVPTETAGFDPARPPPGYSLCHGGHCHHESGRLVPYAEVAADAAGATASVAVSLSAPALDLLTATAQPLTCAPGCDLGLADIRATRAPLASVVVQGMVRDARTPPRLTGETPWRWEAQFPVASSAPLLKGAVNLPVDDDHDPVVDLLLALDLHPRLFDELGWTLEGETLGPAEAARVLDNLTRTPLQATVRRSSF